MKILLLGATGRTGKYVLKQALESDYEVNCLSRNSERIQKQDGITVIEGNPNNKTDLEKAISDCDSIISVLNISRKSDFPWAKLRTPKKYLSDVMNLLVQIAEEGNLKRIVVCSAWGVAETKNDIPKWFIESSNIGIAYQDHERQEKIISESKLDWTIVRPVGLTNSRRKENIKETFDNNSRPHLTISRQSAAKYLVDCLETDQLIGKKVVISKQ
ncbi:NAD(P)-dependent oxidoreductase [Xanthovirga aplysinae]|uniref:NAD(P)-dependent oxidoreductase n=1 Tax=Xanthovirga aplysinae TaxID=2529853 RepID=UPI0012BC3677|nr:NAD(P)H-binding protein [Xanthovirga aplysinae]MTI31189.1 NAD-dependent epimerase/dehydratase family protein [Xanthovirga aplysinae]